MSATIGTRVGHFVWHELVTPDVEAAKAFYAGLFGWEFEIFKPGEMDYAMISANGQTHGGVMAPDTSSGVPPHWFGHVLVDDADAALARAEKLGGKAAYGPMDIPEIGRFVLLADPQGGVVSAYRAAGEDGPAAAGTFLWDEFLAGDVEGAKAFYAGLFGWEFEIFKPGEMDYTMISTNGQSHGGIMAPDPSSGTPSHWFGHVLVDDADAALARAEKLGGKAAFGPMDIPEVGRFALLADPQGGVVSAYRPTGEEGPAAAECGAARPLRSRAA